MKTLKKSDVRLAEVSTQSNEADQQNKQDYKCKSCDILFTNENKSVIPIVNQNTL